jgi:wyosine [tRNA(Phe)-imidazoG37] synthetase (radical SAM superfamily)
MIAFGPVPSRRLGQSLGINNIPPKTCTYECVYCQVGPTPFKETVRREFYEPEEVVRAVEEKVEQTLAAGARIDYLTFVPDGEPTLDINLGKMIDLLHPLEIKIAVITNASLLWRLDVRADLMKADLVSLKVDAVDEGTWRRINRPAPELSFPDVLDGMLSFAQKFKGELLTETMLVEGVNDDEKILKGTASFLHELDPDLAYIAIPTRPPSESWVKAPGEETITMAYQIFSAKLKEVECLTGFSPEAFAVTGDVLKNLLDIIAVHPMRESEVLTFLEEGGAGKKDLKALLREKKLVRVVHDGQPFYFRKLEPAPAVP